MALIPYDAATMTVEAMAQLRAEGHVLVCPACGSPLMMALTTEEARTYEMPLGFRCPIRGHVEQLLNPGHSPGFGDMVKR